MQNIVTIWGLVGSKLGDGGVWCGGGGIGALRLISPLRNSDCGLLTPAYVIFFIQYLGSLRLMWWSSYNGIRVIHAWKVPPFWRWAAPLKVSYLTFVDLTFTRWYPFTLDWSPEVSLNFDRFAGNVYLTRRADLYLTCFKDWKFAKNKRTRDSKNHIYMVIYRWWSEFMMMVIIL